MQNNTSYEFFIVLLSGLLATNTVIAEDYLLGAKEQQAYAKNVSITPFQLGNVTVNQDRSREIPDAFKESTKNANLFAYALQKDFAEVINIEKFVSLAAKISGEYVLIDMRTTSWHKKGHIPGSSISHTLI